MLFSKYSLNTKITISFVILSFFLLFILFVQIIPYLHKKHKDMKINQIEHLVTITSHQLKLAIKLISQKNNLNKIKLNSLKNKSELFDNDIKKDIEKSFEIIYQKYKGTTNLIKVDIKKDKNKKVINLNNSYNLINTGKLTVRDILKATNNKPIYHYLNTKKNPTIYNKEVVTWIKTIYEKDNIKILSITIVDIKKNRSDFHTYIIKMIFATVLAFSIAFIFAFFFLKRILKSINILSNTAKEINKGNISLRSNIKGNDDIAHLAKAFDAMLSSLEENINNLDDKVDEKTKELRKALKEKKNLLEEKEILLKEIHHRVKNNLSMIIELIKIQMPKISDETAQNVLIDIQERILTMELLHKKLYKSKDLSSVSFKNYISELTNDLYITYGKSRDIKTKCFIADINMNIDFALPCGLLITECLTNTYKYAFKEDKGLITISFNKKNDEYILIIHDNGIGLPHDIDINNIQTLGLKIITSIVKGQLLGTIEYKYNKGSEFKIVFKM